MLKNIGIIKKKVEDIYIARPRKLKYGNGEITLSGYSTEEADAIEAFLNKVPTEGPKVGDLVELKEDVIEVIDQTTLSETALDLYLDKEKKEYKVVHVKYNPVSKAAKVTEMISAGSFKLAGVNNLKMEMFKLGKV